MFFKLCPRTMPIKYDWFFLVDECQGLVEQEICKICNVNRVIYNCLK